MATVFMAMVHLPGALFLAYPAVGEPVFPSHWVDVHFLIGVASVLGVAGALLALLRLVSLREVAVVCLLVQLSWTALAFQARHIWDSVFDKGFQPGADAAAKIHNRLGLNQFDQKGHD